MNRRVKTWGLRSLLLAVALTTVGVVHYHRNYPYGWSHCCDTQLSFALLDYAEAHEGWYPCGESSPEASLGLLYTSDPDRVTPYLLRGKTVPLDVVQARLSAGLPLTAETCGWHYVEGLRKDDDGRLALFWDKVGLGHNGERLGRAGHTVWFVSGSSRFIPDEEWDAFRAEQAALRPKR